MININWATLKVLILDVDGTLYNQSQLRKKMIFELLKYYSVRPFRYKELLILFTFRREREKRAGQETANLEEDQYIWCAQKLDVTVNEVKNVIKKWIFDFPNSYLMDCSYGGVGDLIHLMKKNNICTIIYSDYISEDKLKYLGIEAHMNIASTDHQINSLKPNPKGLNHILNAMDVPPQSCLSIGDRDELDGLCANAVGIPFLNIKNHSPDTFYYELINSLNSFLQKNP